MLHVGVVALHSMFLLTPPSLSASHILIAIEHKSACPDAADQVEWAVILFPCLANRLLKVA